MDNDQGAHNVKQFLPIEPYKLYESIIVIKWPNQQKYNTSAMGVRFGSEGEIYLCPFPATDTFELMTNPQVEFLTINLTDDVETFAVAALSGLYKGSTIEELDQSSLIIHEDHAFLKKSQTLILGRIIGRNQKIQLKNSSSSFDDLKLVTSEFSATFQVERLKVFRTSTEPEPVNRGDNLALEAIIYASKIPALQKLGNANQEIHDFVHRIRGFQYDIRRFSASKRALTVCNMIDNFLEKTLKEDY